MERRKKSQGGFTLIELTIVVTVIGILAAIAVPNFLKFVTKAKQSEVKNMLPLIASCEFDHKLRTGKYVACPLNPVKVRDQWNPGAPGWKELGFDPHGARYYSYEVELKGDHFVVRARGNIDMDADVDVWELNGKDMSIENTSRDY